MALTFKQAVALYGRDDINGLASSTEGYRFLLLRSLSRYEHLAEIALGHNLDIEEVGKRVLFEYIYDSDIDTKSIEKIIRQIFARERRIRAHAETHLIGELYKMQEFNWGGLHQNSLDKTIVNNYVKKVLSYDQLNSHIEDELLTSMRGYVRCSWYNHWTSIIIEDIFKEHSAVLPAVGLVKKIDFFVRSVPFDLKVTYLPEGFVKIKRREDGERPELTLLKQQARRASIAIPSKMSDSDLLAHLWTVVADQPDNTSRTLAASLRAYRKKLVDEITQDPDELIKWLYENQGERRFDASNRIFLVLVNESNFFDSWQLKRNRALISKGISEYLNNSTTSIGRDSVFMWEGEEYKSKADVIIVRHTQL
ncbi:hypothetical protein [Methylobacterium sp. WL120]|uniref:hypothetical protein n=1 Tax=Methylobacterium sp. WL120 TaxID=2603887 RepID=UPI0011C8FC87|nr:hypothetical protein [Methylobacterium sp. WL120]TXM67684.1 hypothetical protein FV229_09605 [Methylobacterium sp. WL120]